MHQRSKTLIRHMFLHQLIVYSMWLIQIQQKKLKCKQTKETFTLLLARWLYFTEAMRADEGPEVYFLDCKQNTLKCFHWWI